ncbi:MAG TPA: hypothetical protein VEU11_15320 [Terriglobales bacterium]|nr:hypothetical protein [Terriglobales bacterium]
MKSMLQSSSPVRFWLAEVVIALLALPPNVAAQQTPAVAQPQAPVPPQAPAAQQAKPMAPLPIEQSLKLVVLAGSGELNDLERRVMAPLVVEVLDRESRPVEGADVVFRFPIRGPSATFPGQKSSKTVKTNGQGEAACTGWMANNEVGVFQVHATATYGNQMGEVTIPMSNVTRVVDAGKRKSKHKSVWSSRWVKVGLIAAGGGLAAGLVLARRGGASSPSTITISPGPPIVGGPH